MLHVAKRIPRMAVGLSVGLLLIATGAVACGDDPADTAAEQSQTAAAQAAVSQDAQEQTEPIDAAEQAQPAQSRPDEAAAQPEPQQQAQDATDQPAAQTQAEPQSQPAQQQAVQDPDRDTLIEGERFAATITADDTERLFRFQAAAGAWLRIFVDGKGGMDPSATLLQPDGTEIAVNDDLSATNRDSLIIAQIPTEGLQLISIQPYDASSVGDFIIQVETLTIGDDDDSAVISVGDSADARLNSPLDVDVFEFDLDEGEQVFILVDGDTGVDVLAHVFDPAGDLVQVDDDGGHGLDSEIYFSADAPGLWRVEVWPASNKVGQRQLIGAYRITVQQGLPTSAVNEAVASDLAGVALTFLQALRDGDSATTLALAGPEALTIWGWDDVSDVDRDIRKLQSIDLGGEILQSVGYGDVLNNTRGRVYFQISESDWLRFELIQLGGHWLVDDWAHSVGPPS